jgi:hypothetical protein
MFVPFLTWCKLFVGSNFAFRQAGEKSVITIQFVLHRAKKTI